MNLHNIPKEIKISQRLFEAMSGLYLDLNYSRFRLSRRGKEISDNWFIQQSPQNFHDNDMELYTRTHEDNPWEGPIDISYWGGMGVRLLAQTSNRPTLENFRIESVL